MSLSKIQSFDENYRRDSFSHRVCDDLSEVILQFLPFEDKFRLECVSKQFQRTVFSKEDTLVVSQLIGRAYNWEVILRKCVNIRSLTQEEALPFNWDTWDYLQESEVNLIIKYCHQLVDIRYELSKISDKTKQKFVEKFGSKLIAFNSFKPKDFELIPNSFPNLKQLNFISRIKPSLNAVYYSHFAISLKNQFHLQIKNLRKTAIIFNDCKDEEEMNGLQTFVENNRSLTHLAIILWIRERSDSQFLFTELSKLKKLIDLQIYIRNTDRFSGLLSGSHRWDGFRHIAVNCPQLKSLTLNNLQIQSPSEMTRFMTEIKSLKQLKRLNVFFEIFFNEFEKHFNNSMKGLKNITHLKLGFNYRIINETLLTDIDKYLPNLQNMFISTNIKATEETADILSRLSRLESLELYINKSNADIIERKVIEKCRKIKSLKFTKF